MDFTSRRGLAVVAAMLIAVVALGVLIVRVVGGDDGQPAGAAPLGQPAAVAAILKPEDLGDGYTAGDAEITSYTVRAPGCLAAIRRLAEAADSQVHVVRTFRGPSTAPASAVSSQVSAYASVAQARTALATFREATSGCTSVIRAKGKAGFEFDVNVRELSAADYDEQVRIQAVGSSATARGNRVPLALSISVVRTGSSLAIVTMYETHDDAEEHSADRMDAVTAAAVRRLASAS